MEGTPVLVPDAVVVADGLSGVHGISTESGDGRHNDVRRELSGIFHAIIGGNERFRTGEIIDAGAEGLDLYNTMLSAYGAGRVLGPGSRPYREITSVLK